MGTSRSEPGGKWGLGWVPPLAAAVPLVAGPWWREGYMVPKAAVCGILGLAGALAWVLSGRRQNIASRVDAPAAAFTGAFLLAALFSCDSRLSWFGRYPEALFAVSGLAACAAAFHLGCGLRSARQEGPLLRWLCALSIPVSAYALAQSGGFDPLLRAALPEGRVVSTFGSPVHLGAYLALVLPCALMRWVQGEGALERRVGAAAFFTGVPALAATGSRGALLAGVCGLAASWMLGRRSSAYGREPGRDLGLVSWKFAVRAAASVALAVLAAFAWRGRGSGAADMARWDLWRVAVSQFQEKPWLGQGPDTFELSFQRLRSEEMARRLGGLGPTQSHPHNDWFQVLGALGLAGTAAYLWLHLGALRGAWAAARSGSPFAGALAGGVLAVLVQAKFNSPSLAVAWLACLMAGALLAAPGRSGTAAALFLAGALAGAGLTGRAALADRQARLGLEARRAGAPKEAALSFELAIAAAPEVTLYRYDLANLLWDASSAVSGPGRVLMLERAGEAAREGVRARPLDAQAHRLLALAALRGEEGGVSRDAEALAAARRALELDPNGGLTLETFVLAARKNRDEGAARAAEERLARIMGGKEGTAP